MPPHLAFFHCHGVYQTFLRHWPGTTVLPISASQVARIKGVSLQHVASQSFEDDDKLCLETMVSTHIAIHLVILIS
jgi:hypothetical protein